MIKAVLFDLDGTLLPMDQDVFIGEYFKRLARKMVDYGYEPEKLIKTVWKGTGVMIQNDGSCTNEKAFWNFFASVYGEAALKDIDTFTSFYANEFQEVQAVCGYNPEAAKVISLVRERGLRPVLATNPLFPAIATQSRIRWAGLKPEDFELYTTYEDYKYSKPNLKYYQELLDKLGLNAEECLMVGNDVDEDMIVSELGMKCFLLTDCLINKNNKDISNIPHGGFAELKEVVGKL